eukprot:15958535-Heterocapsa_arctica.AAC.1
MPVSRARHLDLLVHDLQSRHSLAQHVVGVVNYVVGHEVFQPRPVRLAHVAEQPRVRDDAMPKA